MSGNIHILGRLLGPPSGTQRIVSVPSGALLFLECPASSAVPARIVLTSVFDGLENMRLRTGSYYLGIEPKSCEASFVLDPPSGEYQLFDVPLRWHELGRALSLEAGPPIIIVCGPRKVGKSSFCRFLVNSLLNSFPQVTMADLDGGQTEFTPPGFISLKVLRDALLGRTAVAISFPHHLHAGPPARNMGTADCIQYLGFSGVDLSPKHYFLSVRRLFSDFAKQGDPPMPIVVNTMGWITGTDRCFCKLILCRRSWICAPATNCADDKAFPSYCHEKRAHGR